MWLSVRFMMLILDVDWPIQLSIMVKTIAFFY